MAQPNSVSAILDQIKQRPLRETLQRIGRLRIDGGLRYHAGPPILNRLGYQVFRSIYTSTAWHLRDLPVGELYRPHVETLERDGCVAIPDFLPPEVFAAVRAEYDRSRQTLPYEVWVVEDNNVVEEMIDLSFHAGRLPITEAAVVDSATLRSIVAGALRRPIGAPPRVWAKRWQKADTPQKPRALGHVIGSNYLHADVHYPTFKAFFYLNDIDERNGAFIYAMGSHRMTPARLAYEYEASVRLSKMPSSAHAEVPAGYARIPTEQQLAAMKINCRSITGKANTMVIANTQGFHRQGDFEPGTAREALMFCFRSSEPGFLMGKRLAPPGVANPAPANSAM